jgi:ATP-dependent RNA helicase RhlE
MTFQELQLLPSLLTTLTAQGYETPSPIQAQAIPVLLNGKDVLASAQTGTGKTAAFALPIIQRLSLQPNHSNKRMIKALILAPTRELAEQIKESFMTYTGSLNLKTAVIYGGVSQKNQEHVLKRGVDVLIATPGRLIDLMNQQLIDLHQVTYFVLDEADHMLDMGFIRDVRRIVKAIPQQRQTMLFSATIPKEILDLANELLTQPVRIEVTPPEAMIEKIEQSLYYVSKKQKTLLLRHLLKNQALQSVLVFSRTKHGANKLVKELLATGINADAIHGNKSQNQRLAALKDFKSGNVRVLVATDIAARGIDIDDLSHVINYDLPDTPETYVHRMGRTGRAGRVGEAYTFCSQEESHMLAQIKKLTKMSIPVVENQPYHTAVIPEPVYVPAPLQQRKRNRNRNKTRVVA